MKQYIKPNCLSVRFGHICDSSIEFGSPTTDDIEASAYRGSGFWDEDDDDETPRQIFED